MNKGSFVTCLAILAVAAAGCGRSSTPAAKPASNKTGHFHGDGHDHKTGDSLDESERAIELQAQRAKQDIDNVTAEAEAALRKTRQQTTTKVQAHARELQEYSAELAEEAKDRAEDVPAAVDNATARTKESPRSGLQSAQDRLRAAEERLSEDATESDRR